MSRFKREKFFTKCLIICILLYTAYFIERIFDLLEAGYQEPATFITVVLITVLGQLWNMASIEKTKTKAKGVCSNDENQLGSEMEQP